MIFKLFSLSLTLSFIVEIVLGDRFITHMYVLLFMIRIFATNNRDNCKIMYD